MGGKCVSLLVQSALSVFSKGSGSKEVNGPDKDSEVTYTLYTNTWHYSMKDLPKEVEGRTVRWNFKDGVPGSKGHGVRFTGYIER